MMLGIEVTIHSAECIAGGRGFFLLLFIHLYCDSGGAASC